MTQVDFYQIESSEDPLVFACRLIEKVYRLGHQIHVHVSSETQASALDALLWSFKATAFIPHERAQENARAPVLICHEAVPVKHHDVLINLNPGIPEFFSRFNRSQRLCQRMTKNGMLLENAFDFIRPEATP